MFNFFKKKEKKVSTNGYKFHQVFVKKKKSANIYPGQFLKIDDEIVENNDMIKDVKYYFISLKGEDVTNKIQKQHQQYCEKYNYGIVKSINDDIVEILIICIDGYVQKYEIELNCDFHDGDAFIIKNGLLYENNNPVGKIIDTRYNPNIQILLNGIENDKLNVFIRK